MLPILRTYGCLFLAFTFIGATPPLAPRQSVGNDIKLLALNQPPCSVPNSKSIIKLKLAYRIAETEVTDHGFEVSVKFQSTTPGMTFSLGRLGQVAVTSKADSLTVEYPMATILRAPGLQRPVTCYLYLHRNMGGGRSRVIAQTPAIVFQECL